MRSVWLLTRRELQRHLSGAAGLLTGALLLFIEALLFQTVARGHTVHTLDELVRAFFYFSSGTTLVAGALLSMRAYAEEAKAGTDVLWRTAPVSAWQVALSKWLGAALTLWLWQLVSLYMPIWATWPAGVPWGHLAAGTLGMLLLGGVATAAGAWASSLSPAQSVAAIAAGVVLTALVLLWQLRTVIGGELGAFLGAADVFHQHYQPFMRGEVHLKDVVYDVCMTMFFLLLTVHRLSGMRWRA